MHVRALLIFAFSASTLCYAAKRQNDLEGLAVLDICSAAKAGHLQAVPFDQMHGVLSFRPDETSSLSHYSIGPGMARVDLDNDGSPDNLVQLIYESSGRQCNEIRFAFLDASRTTLLSQAVQKKLDPIEQSCDAAGPIDGSLNILRHKNTTYIEQLQKAGKKIYRISPQGTVLVCDIKKRPNAIKKVSTLSSQK